MVATVIIPTFDHGRLLRTAVRSVQRQTLQDFELFIVGDGITDETRRIIGELLPLDSRIRFFDHPKSPRRGEPYRHLALQEASGRCVCYLSDDDLWFPNHLEVTCDALSALDVAHSRTFWVTTEGRVFGSLLDWRVPEWVDSTLQNKTPMGISFCAHTLEFYRRLPYGWRTTPDGKPTDQHMWQQLFSVDGVRAACTGQHTVINFPAIHRADWGLDRREEELVRWEKKIVEEPNATLALVRYSLSIGSFYNQKELDKWQRRKDAIPKNLLALLHFFGRGKQ